MIDIVAVDTYPSGRLQTYGAGGTITLFAALNYLDGKLIARTEAHHTHIEWLRFLKQIEVVELYEKQRAKGFKGEARWRLTERMRTLYQDAKGIG